MDATKSLIDLNRRRIENLRTVYINGESDNLSAMEIKNVFLARQDLIKYAKLDSFDEKILKITKYLLKHKKDKEEFDLIYIVFTKAFDFVLTYDKNSGLRELFIRYCNLLFAFINKGEKLLNINKNNYEKMFISIKNLTFDIQTLLFKLYFNGDEQKNTIYPEMNKS